MPVVRVANYLLFPGGATRRISRWEQLMHRVGRRPTVTAQTDWERQGLRGA